MAWLEARRAKDGSIHMVRLLAWGGSWQRQEVCKSG